jgi:hypothetical protein
MHQTVPLIRAHVLGNEQELVTFVQVPLLHE